MFLRAYRSVVSLSTRMHVNFVFRNRIIGGMASGGCPCYSLKAADALMCHIPSIDYRVGIAGEVL